MSDQEESRVVMETVEEGPCKRRFKAEVSAEAVQSELDSSYQQLRTSVQMPGFRPGKVPRSILEKKYGEKLRDEVREELIQDSFRDEVEKQELKIVGTPAFEKVEFETGQPLRFEAVFEIVPDFEVPEFKGLEIEGRSVAVSAQDVQDEIENIRERWSRLVDVDAGSQAKDDFANADIRLSRDDEELMDRSDVYLKIGDDHVDNIPVEGLSSKLLEAAVDTEFSAQVEIPDDFPKEEIRGETVDLTVKVRGFRRTELPEFNEEFLGRFQVESREAFEDLIQKGIERRREMEEEKRLEEELVDRLVEATEMDLPESVVESQTETLTENLRMRLGQEGKSQEEIEATVVQDKSAAEDARKEIKQYFILEKIAADERVFVTEDDVARQVAETAMSYQVEPAELLADYQKNGMLGELRAGLRREKVRSLIREKAKVQGDDIGSTVEADGSDKAAEPAVDETDSD